MLWYPIIFQPVPVKRKKPMPAALAMVMELEADVKASKDYNHQTVMSLDREIATLQARLAEMTALLRRSESLLVWHKISLEHAAESLLKQQLHQIVQDINAALKAAGDVA
jgi:hypothetical protein